MLLVFVHLDMDWIAAITAIFEIILIFAAGIYSDMSWMATEWTHDSLMQQLHNASKTLELRWCASGFACCA
jgi:hypothetical protein